MRSLILSFFILTIFARCNCQQAKDITFHGTLPQALLVVDQTFHVSVLGELAAPLPANVSVELGPSSTAPMVFNALVKQCPGYVVLERKGAFLFVQSNLLSAPGNPMNQVLRSYTIPNNLGQFKLTFPSAVGAAKHGVSGSGGMVNGFSLPESISPALTPVELHDRTAREILLHVAHEVGNLYSVLILPSAHPAKHERGNTDFSRWELAGGKGLANYRSHFTGHPSNRLQAVPPTSGEMPKRDAGVTP